MIDNRLEKLARVLTEYSTSVKEGDIVAVSADDAAIPFIKAVSKAAIKRGGIVNYYVDMPEIDEVIVKNGSEAQLTAPNKRFGDCAKSDVWISAWGGSNLMTMASADGERLKRRRLGNMENRRIYNKRSANGELRWCGTQFPLDSDAQYAGMSLAEYEDFVYSAGFIYEDDPIAKWREIEAFQEKWVNYLNGKKELHIVSADTDIVVNIAGRKWINCCGHENFPDGEIFTSPVETDINGYITFSYPAIINGDEFPRVRLEVKDGLIVTACCADEEKNAKLLSYLDTDKGSRRFGEVAIGTNYGIDRYTKNILFDEKMGGTMHMAVGSAMEDAGGSNESAIHWDMINDMRQCGRIYADGELFYENGGFVDGVL